MDPRVIALHVECEACGETARLVADCDRYAAWATAHVLPVIVWAEVVGVIGVRRIPLHTRP